MRYLTKSRFKLGLECPNKLYYTNKDKEYANTKSENPFLTALASGGFKWRNWHVFITRMVF
jgi:hypothetical protein